MHVTLEAALKHSYNSSISTPFSLSDLAMGAAFAVVAVLLFAFFCHYHNRSTDTSIVIGAFVIKLVASLIFSLVLVYYYKDGDSLLYHKAGILSAQQIRSDIAFNTSYYLESSPFFWIDGWSTTRLFSLSGLVHFILFDSFIASSFFFAVLGFIGQVLLYRTFVALYPAPRLRIWWMLGILFFPSLTYWSSGLLKDSIGIWALGGAVWGAYGLTHKLSLKNMGLLFVGAYSLFLYRTQVLPPLIICLVPWLLFGVRDRMRPNSRGVTLSTVARQFVGICFILAAFVAMQRLGESQSRYSVGQLPQNLNKQSSEYDADTDNDDKTFDSSWSGLIVDAPEATIRALYRPFVWEAEGIVGQLAALEGLVLLALTLRAIYQALHIQVLRESVRSPAFVMCLLFVALFALIVGVSTPNLGSVSRYRIPLVPFFCGAIIILEYHWQEFRNKAQARHRRRWQAPNYGTLPDVSPGARA